MAGGSCWHWVVQRRQRAGAEGGRHRRPGSQAARQREAREEGSRQQQSSFDRHCQVMRAENPYGVGGQR